MFFLLRILRAFFYVSLNSHFHILNNITYIFTHFFIYTYFEKLQKSHFKLPYQTPPKYFNTLTNSILLFELSNFDIYIYIYKVLKFSSSSLCINKWNHSQIHYNSFMGKVNGCFNGIDLEKKFRNFSWKKNN